jgi:phage gp36-like protein
MDYVTRDDMLGVVPADLLTVAVDDSQYGVETEGIWDVIAAAAARRINGILASRYPVPFSAPLPPVVADAAVVFAAEALYMRRQIKDNPWTTKADKMEARLQSIADGDADLSATETGSGSASPSAITEPARTYNGGRIIL